MPLESMNDLAVVCRFVECGFRVAIVGDLQLIPHGSLRVGDQLRVVVHTSADQHQRNELVQERVIPSRHDRLHLSMAHRDPSHLSRFPQVVGLRVPESALEMWTFQFIPASTFHVLGTR